jgi:hypothetical protein
MGGPHDPKVSRVESGYLMYAEPLCKGDDRCVGYLKAQFCIPINEFRDAREVLSAGVEDPQLAVRDRLAELGGERRAPPAERIHQKMANLSYD